MSKKAALIAAAAALALIAGFLLWRHIHAARYAVPKKPAPPVLAVKKKEAQAALLPVVAKKFKSPKVAVVMDDFGYNKNGLDELFSIEEPITLSVLPSLPYSAEIAALAAAKKREVILHLPLEPSRKDVAEEVDTIKSGMSASDIARRLEREISSVPGLAGVSNHMGSKSTEDSVLMTTILSELKRRGLYFFDSLTSEKSVCREIAAAVGVRYARRDMFLDNSNDTGYIGRQVLELRRLAFRKGRVIAVCHDRSNTIAVLAKMLPRLSQDGIKFVRLSEMVR